MLCEFYATQYHKKLKNWTDGSSKLRSLRFEADLIRTFRWNIQIFPKFPTPKDWNESNTNLVRYMQHNTGTVVDVSTQNRHRWRCHNPPQMVGPNAPLTLIHSLLARHRRRWVQTRSSQCTVGAVFDIQRPPPTLFSISKKHRRRCFRYPIGTVGADYHIQKAPSTLFSISKMHRRRCF